MAKEPILGLASAAAGAYKELLELPTAPTGALKDLLGLMLILLSLMLAPESGHARTVEEQLKEARAG
eukprot:1161974-Pelagomonas_calceolata.AAC.3